MTKHLNAANLSFTSTECPTGHRQRRSTGARAHLSLWLQLSLAAMFFCEAFVYTIIDPYLPQAFPYVPEAYLSITFGAYSISQLAATVLLVLLQVIPKVAAIRPQQDYLISAAAFSVFTLTGCLATAAPHSIAVALLQRILLGLAAAVFSVHVYKGVARALNPRDSLRAISCINAGLVAGDCVAPIVGNLVYRLAGVRVISGLQPAVCAAALLLVVALPAGLAIEKRCQKQRFLRQQQQQLQQQPQQQQQDWFEDATVSIGPDASQQQLHLVQLQHRSAKPCTPIEATMCTSPQLLATSLPPCTGTCGDAVSCSGTAPADADQVPSHTACIASRPACLLNNHHHHQQQQQQQEKQHRLPNSSVVAMALPAMDAVASSTTAAGRTKLLWKCLCNLSLTSQLCVLILTQCAASLGSILIPDALKGEPLWMVPTLFGVQAVCSILGPFIMQWPKVNTSLLMAIMASALAAASGIVLPAATASQFTVVFFCCAVAGAAYSTLEVLVFHHATQITTAAGCEVAEDLGAILYTLYYCAGNTLGGMLGGAVAEMNNNTPAHVAQGVSGLIFVYGFGLFVTAHVGRRNQNAKVIPQ